MSQNPLFELSPERKRYHAALNQPVALARTWLALTGLAVAAAFLAPPDWVQQGLTLTGGLYAQFMSTCDPDIAQQRLMLARATAALAFALAALWPITGLFTALRRPPNPEGLALGYTPLRLVIFAAFPVMAVANLLMAETVRGTGPGCAAFRSPGQFALYFTIGLIAVLVAWFYRAAVLGPRR